MGTNTHDPQLGHVRAVELVQRLTNHGKTDGVRFVEVRWLLLPVEITK